VHAGRVRPTAGPSARTDDVTALREASLFQWIEHATRRPIRNLREGCSDLGSSGYRPPDPFQTRLAGLPALADKGHAPQQLSGCNNDRGRGGNDRRSVIGKCPDTRQAGIQRAGQGWPAQDEREGENETDGSHLTVSGFWPALSAVFVGELIISHRFRSSASKSKNGFAGREIVSQRQSNETKLQKLK